MKSAIRAAMVSALVLAAALPVFAQAYSPPRAADGHPDFTGVWSNQSLTNLSRPANVKLSVTKAEADEMVRTNPWIRLAQSEEGASNLADGLLDDKNNDRGYNTFWIDPGQSLATVKGEIRTSWIVDPPSGQLPVAAAAQTARRDASAKRRVTIYEGPETLPIWERCLIGFTGAGGPGMMNVIYNNNYHFVQTPTHVMILVEMAHDARIIPIFETAEKAKASHKPAAIKPWLGDSVGWWEGDVLVVETINLHPEQTFANQIIFSDQGKLTERFSRASDKQITYEFAVDDPKFYTQPWRAEQAMNKRDESVYEYACHEGNYAMEGILRGARLADQRGEKPTSGPGIFGTPIPSARAGQ